MSSLDRLAVWSIKPMNWYGINVEPMRCRIIMTSVRKFVWTRLEIYVSIFCRNWDSGASVQSYYVYLFAMFTTNSMNISFHFLFALHLICHFYASKGTFSCPGYTFVMHEQIYKSMQVTGICHKIVTARLCFLPIMFPWLFDNNLHT